MGLDFDVLEICRKLRNSKQPPYECPVAECGKIYKSLCGLQYHLVNFDHNAPPPVNSTPTPGKHSHLMSRKPPFLSLTLLKMFVVDLISLKWTMTVFSDFHQL